MKALDLIVFCAGRRLTSAECYLGGSGLECSPQKIFQIEHAETAFVSGTQESLSQQGLSSLLKFSLKSEIFNIYHCE